MTSALRCTDSDATYYRTMLRETGYDEPLVDEAVSVFAVDGTTRRVQHGIVVGGPPRLSPWFAACVAVVAQQNVDSRRPGKRGPVLRRYLHTLLDAPDSRRKLGEVYMLAGTAAAEEALLALGARLCTFCVDPDTTVPGVERVSAFCYGCSFRVERELTGVLGLDYEVYVDNRNGYDACVSLLQQAQHRCEGVVRSVVEVGRTQWRRELLACARWFAVLLEVTGYGSIACASPLNADVSTDVSTALLCLNAVCRDEGVRRMFVRVYDLAGPTAALDTALHKCP